MKKIFFIAFVLNICTHSFCSAQKSSLSLKIKGKDSLENRIIDSLSYLKKFENFSSLKKEIDSLQIKLIRTGYINTDLININKINDSTITANLVLKAKINSLKIFYRDDDIPRNIIKTISPKVTESYFTIPFNKTESSLQYLTNYLVNQGDTFGYLTLKNIKNTNQTIEAQLTYKKGNHRKIDAIEIKGYNRFPKSFLKYYARLRKEQTFNQEDLIKKAEILNSLNFTKTIKPPEVLFQKDSTSVFIYLKKKSANNFDGFLGFSNEEETGDLEFNGYINLNLVNNLNFGERLNLIYKNDGNEQQRFELRTSLPYIFKTPIGIEAGLEIFKKDSSFIITEQEANLNYIINNKTNISIGYTTINSSNLLDNTQSLLLVEDYNTSFGTIGFQYQIPQQNLLFPTKLLLSTKLGIGSRKTENATTNQTKGEISLSYNLNLNNRNSIAFKNILSILFSEDYLTNELFRFGGINSIRGFEENSINASLYNTLISEYRYLLSPNLYMHSVIDYAYFEDNSNDISKNLTSFGFGLGLNTSTGLFKMIFANGKTNNQSFKFSNTKVHISLISKF